jgi:hypothetical protein
MREKLILVASGMKRGACLLRSTEDGYWIGLYFAGSCSLYAEEAGEERVSLV